MKILSEIENRLEKQRGIKKATENFENLYAAYFVAITSVNNAYFKILLQHILNSNSNNFVIHMHFNYKYIIY